MAVVVPVMLYEVVSRYVFNAPTVWGIQHHPEVDADLIRPWADQDRDLHLSQGLDPETVLAEIDAARDELEAAWRPLAARFVEVAVNHR